MNSENIYPGVVLILPETTKKGEVKVVSPATKMIIGDVVLFNPEPFVEITIDGTTYRVVKEENILGWFTKVPRFNPE